MTIAPAHDASDAVTETTVEASSPYAPSQHCLIPSACADDLLAPFGLGCEVCPQIERRDGE